MDTLHINEAAQVWCYWLCGEYQGQLNIKAHVNSGNIFQNKNMFVRGSTPNCCPKVSITYGTKFIM